MAPPEGSKRLLRKLTRLSGSSRDSPQPFGSFRRCHEQALKKPGKTVAKTFAGETAFGKGPLGTAQSFFSEENWAVQAFKALAALPASKPRQSDEGRA
jgi:hypothetical protein